MGWVCGEFDAQSIPLSISVHTILMCDCVNYGPHNNATKGKSHYTKCAHKIYHKPCKVNMLDLDIYLIIWTSIYFSGM